jgi:hypothetical protein
LGVLPLSFEEGSGRRRPVDRLQLPVPHHDPLDHDPTELLPARPRGRGDRLRQGEKTRPVGMDEEARGVAQAAVAERIVSAVPAVLAISRDVDRPWRSVPHIR